jgi:choline dehydrogenase
LETPDIQYHIQPFSANKVADGAHTFSAFTASVLQLRPESVGKIELKSANPHEYPAIHPNYLSTQTDCDTVVSALKMTRKICQEQPVKSLITEEYAPGDSIGINDDEALLDWARNNATTIYHPVGTCKMGQDKMSVVDERLCVKGVSNLRVADASIMPSITSGNTNAPSIMIGEKLSDLVLSKYKKAI